MASSFELDVIRRLDALAHDAQRSGILSGLNQAAGRLADVGKKIDQVDEKADRTFATVQEIRDRQNTVLAITRSIRDELRLADSRSAARDRRARLVADMRERFAFRTKVRNLALSLASEPGQAMIEHGLLDPETIRRLAQQHAIEDTGFWLGPAVIALAAQYRQDTEEFELAWTLTGAADEAKNALFTAFVHAGLGRERASASSMDAYLRSLDRHALGREFFHVFNALAAHEFGGPALSYAEQTLRAWTAELDAAGAAQNARWIDLCGEHLLKTDAPPLPGDLAELREWAADWWTGLEEHWRAAGACAAAAAHLRDRLDAPEPGRGRPVHAALDALINEPGPDELEYLREIREQDLIEKHHGDTVAAAAEAEVIGDIFSATADFPTLLIRAALPAGEPSSTAAGRRLALALSARWIAAAAERITARAEAERPRLIDLAHGEWTGTFDAAAPAGREAERLAASLYSHRAQMLPRPRGAETGLLLAAVAAAIGTIGLTRLSGAGTVVFVVVAALMLAVAAVDLSRYPARRRAHHIRTRRVRSEVDHQIGGVVDQGTRLLDHWDDTVRDGHRRLTALLDEVTSGP